MGAFISTDKARTLQPAKAERKIHPENIRNVVGLKPSAIISKKQPSNDFGF